MNKVHEVVVFINIVLGLFATWVLAQLGMLDILALLAGILASLILTVVYSVCVVSGDIERGE